MARPTGFGSSPEEVEEYCASLEQAATSCSALLNTLSMGTEGVLRARICEANNILRAALGRPLHHIAENMRAEEG